MHVKTNDMKYTSQAKQLTIDDFKSSLEGLSKSNRWVQLGYSLPWAKIEKLYMLGLPEFTDKPIFDPSLFVTIRKRIGEDFFNDMSVSLLERQIQLQEESEKKKVKTIISKYIAILCSQLKIKQPECNYKSARKEYLNLIKKKKKKVSEVKIAKRMLLYYLNRDEVLKGTLPCPF